MASSGRSYAEGDGGAPTGAAGGGLSGDYPDPSVVDDGHSHTAATLPATLPPSAHTHSASDITSGTVATARLGSGAANSSNYLRGDQSWTAVSSGSGDVAGPASATDNALVRYDTTTGKLIQNGVITESDAGALTGATQLDVDNLRLDGNTLSSTDTNGNIALAPNGTGVTIAPVIAGSVSAAGKLILRPNIADSTSYVEIQNGLGAAVIIGFRNALIEANKDMYGPGSGPLVRFATSPSSTTPTLVPNGGNAGTGIGQAGTNQLSGVAGSVEIWRASAAAGNVSAGMQALHPVEANTAVVASPNLLSATETRGLLHNTGATAENYHTLPSGAPIGYEQWFSCQDADGIRIVAQSGEVISLGPGAVSTTGGFVRSVVAESVVGLLKITSTKYIAIYVGGTWTVDI